MCAQNYDETSNFSQLPTPRIADLTPLTGVCADEVTSMHRGPIVLLHLAGTISSTSTSMRISGFFSVGLRRAHSASSPSPSPAATFAHFASESSASASSFDPSVLVDAGIGRVAFLRHGNTSPAPVGGTDFDRVLTELGEGQARSAGSSFGASDLSPLHPAVLSSPAPRCVATADIFLEAAAAAPVVGSDDSADDDGKGPPAARPVIETVQTLYDGTMQPEGGRLFRKHGYAPLRTYLEDGDGEDREAAATVLGGYADDFLRSLTDALAVGGGGGGGGGGDDDENCVVAGGAGGTTTLLVVGHAVYLPSAALALASACGCGGDGGIDLILDTNTGEAEGYLIDVEPASVGLLRRPATPTEGDQCGSRG